MTTISRRSAFMAGAALIGMAGLPLGTRSAGAQGAPRKLILVLASGGWDPTYSLDPKPTSDVVDAPEGTVQEFSGLPVLTHESRPSVAAFFTRYAERSAIVNGIQV